MEKPSEVECPYCGKSIKIVIQRAEERKAKQVTLKEVKTRLKGWNEGLTINEDKGKIGIKPKNYLGRKVWRAINDALKPFNPEWVSEGKESMWIIRKG